VVTGCRLSRHWGNPCVMLMSVFLAMGGAYALVSLYQFDYCKHHAQEMVMAMFYVVQLSLLQRMHLRTESAGSFAPENFTVASWAQARLTNRKQPGGPGQFCPFCPF